MREGQTGTAPDGTKVVFRGGRIVPLYDAPVAGGSVGNKAYYTQYGKDAAKMDIAELDEIKQLRNNAGSLTSNAYEADRLLRQRNNLTGPLFEAAQFAGRINPFSDKERLADMRTFEQLASEGVLENVKKLPGPLSEKELAFLTRTSYDKEGLPEENDAVALRRAEAAKKMTAFADAKQEWINQYGSSRNRDPQGRTFDQVWQDIASSETFAPEDMRGSRRKPKTAYARTDSPALKRAITRGDKNEARRLAFYDAWLKNGGDPNQVKAVYQRYAAKKDAEQKAPKGYKVLGVRER